MSDKRRELSGAPAICGRKDFFHHVSPPLSTGCVLSFPRPYVDGRGGCAPPRDQTGAEEFVPRLSRFLSAQLAAPGRRADGGALGGPALSSCRKACRVSSALNRVRRSVVKCFVLAVVML